MAFHINFLSNQTEIKHTWLSQEVATRKLALGLKLRLETESFGGWPTYEKFNHSKPNLWQSQRKHWDLQRQYLLTSNELFGLGFGLDTKKFDIEEASQVKWGTTCERERESHINSPLFCFVWRERETEREWELRMNKYSTESCVVWVCGLREAVKATLCFCNRPLALVQLFFFLFFFFFFFFL